jgi:hypothetical protein
VKAVRPKALCMMIKLRKLPRRTQRKGTRRVGQPSSIFTWPAASLRAWSQIDPHNTIFVQSPEYCQP